MPTKVKEDTAFPFEAGDPCLVEIDTEGGGLIVRPVSVEEAVRLGWRERRRGKKSLCVHYIGALISRINMIMYHCARYGLFGVSHATSGCTGFGPAPCHSHTLCKNGL